MFLAWSLDDEKGAAPHMLQAGNVVSYWYFVRRNFLRIVIKFKK